MGGLQFIKYAELTRWVEFPPPHRPVSNGGQRGDWIFVGRMSHPTRKALRPALGSSLSYVKNGQKWLWKKVLCAAAANTSWPETHDAQNAYSWYVFYVSQMAFPDPQMSLPNPQMSFYVER